MARGKKAEQALTPEEKLEQALVSAEEQPYVVPGNWCWCKIVSICDFERGITFPASAKEHGRTETNIPCLRTANIQDELKIDDLLYVDKGYVKNNEAKYVHSDDIIMSSANSKELVGKVCYVYSIPVPMTFGGFVLAIRVRKIYSKYLFYYLRFEFLSGKFIGKSTQTTNIANVNTMVLGNIEFPLSPLAEQQRIVNRIDHLFAKLDVAKKKAQVVLDGFELRKSVILHKAFTGELTEKWRQIHNVRFDNWETKRINEITKPRAGYAFDSKKFTNSGYQIIRMGNMYGGELDLTRNPVFISKEDVDETMLNKAIVNDGDILITLTGTKYKRDYGYAVCVFNTENLLVNQRILCLTPSQNVIRNYILYYLRSNIFRDIFFSNETGGVNQGNVSSKFVENIGIKVPSLIEQHEIVAILDRLLDKEQQAKEAAESVLTQIDTMKKSILSRAFRGELGTNDPTEESALELLKTIL